MNKRIITIVVSLLVLAMSVTLLLVFMLGKNKNDDSEYYKPLNCIVRDLKISVGQRVDDFYQINDKTAKVSIKVDNKDVIEINESYLEGKKSGRVNVTLEIENTKEKLTKTFVVEVFEIGHKFKINTIEFCDFDYNSSSLTIFDNSALFEIEIFDLMNNKIENLNLSYDYDKNSFNVLYEFGQFHVFDIKNADNITFNCPTINYSFSINIIFKPNFD